MRDFVDTTFWTFLFAAICCVIASALLAGNQSRLGDMMKKNKELDQQRSVLMAAGLIDNRAGNEVVAEWFKKQDDGKAWIEPVIIDKATGEKSTADVELKAYLKKPRLFPEQLLVYECLKEDEECFILPVVGKGLWGALYGYVALAKNGNTVLGISFYDHKETPGLGAEIVEPWFRDQFVKKLLLKNPGDFTSFKGIEVKKGIKVDNLPEVDQPYAVDGISGATITSDGVTDIMQDYLKNYIPYLKRKAG